MYAPIKTRPVFKQYIWGGSTLKDKYNKEIEDDFAAESWEISCHEDGLCLAADGDFAGRTLRDVIYSDRENMMGEDAAEVFPLLVKFLDANDKLSVQVHPDNEFAAKYENGSLGKTEMWYVIDAKPGARLVYGLKDGVTREQLRAAIEGGVLEELLNFVPVKKGDSFFIPSGTVHAICEGMLIAEIQQSSNTTYRMYDYNRTDANGNMRELHVEKAIAATKLSGAKEHESTGHVIFTAGDSSVELLAECEYFAVMKYSVDGKTDIVRDRRRFEMLVCTEGDGELIFDGGKSKFRAGDSFFVPAALSDYAISGHGEILRSFVPAAGEHIG